MSGISTKVSRRDRSKGRDAVIFTISASDTGIGTFLTILSLDLPLDGERNLQMIFAGSGLQNRDESSYTLRDPTCPRRTDRKRYILELSRRCGEARPHCFKVSGSPSRKLRMWLNISCGKGELYTYHYTMNSDL